MLQLWISSRNGDRVAHRTVHLHKMLYSRTAVPTSLWMKGVAFLLSSFDIFFFRKINIFRKGHTFRRSEFAIIWLFKTVKIATSFLKTCFCARESSWIYPGSQWKGYDSPVVTLWSRNASLFLMHGALCPCCPITPGAVQSGNSCSLPLSLSVSRDEQGFPGLFFSLSKYFAKTKQQFRLCMLRSDRSPLPITVLAHFHAGISIVCSYIPGESKSWRLKNPSPFETVINVLCLYAYFSSKVWQNYARLQRHVTENTNIIAWRETAFFPYQIAQVCAPSAVLRGILTECILVPLC